jgi:hypothetical protein
MIGRGRFTHVIASLLLALAVSGCSLLPSLLGASGDQQMAQKRAAVFAASAVDVALSATQDAAITLCAPEAARPWICTRPQPEGIESVRYQQLQARLGRAFRAQAAIADILLRWKPTEPAPLELATLWADLQDAQTIAAALRPSGERDRMLTRLGAALTDYKTIAAWFGVGR